MKNDIGELSESSDSTGTTTSTRSFERSTQTTTTAVIVPGGKTAPENYQYDNYGRENQRTDPREASTWSDGYDAIHRRKDAKREDRTRWDYGYNFKSEVTTANKLLSNSQVVPGQKFAYDYDGMGNRKTSSAGGATTGYSSNGLNQYTSITTPGAVDVLSRSPSPVTATLGGQSASITQQGNLYNARATLTNAPNGSYYTTSISSGTSTQTGSRWLAPASVTPQYDDDGNLTTDGRWTYSWDAENRLVKMTTRPTAISAGAPNITLDYTNDFIGRRIGEKTTTFPAVGIPSVSETRFLYEAWNPVAEFSVSSSQPTTLTSQRLLLWGLDLSGTPQGAGGVSGLLLITNHSAPLTSYLPSYDSNGNIIAWSNHTGQLISRQDYDPFGNTILKETYVPTTGLDAILNYGFSTKPQNGITGLLYYGYRYYDSVTGKWPSRDPIEEEGGVNLYGFAGNDGVNGWDYLGWAKGVFRVAFRGAGDIDPESEFAGFTGNLYSSTDVGSGLKAVIAHYDTDGDGRLTKKDCPPFRVKIVGYSWGGISALYLAKQIGGKTEEPDKNLHIGIGTLDPVTTLRGGGGSAVTGGFPGYVRKAYNNYQTNGMWRGPLGVFGAGAFKGSSVAGAVNKDHSSDRPGGKWASMGDPKKPWEDHISIQRHAAGLVSKVQAIDLAGEK